MTYLSVAGVVAYVQSELFIAYLGKFSWLRINTGKREQCDDCMDCFKICPEPQVIKLALKNLDNKPIILAANCTNCGRYIDK